MNLSGENFNFLLKNLYLTNYLNREKFGFLEIFSLKNFLYWYILANREHH
ncbi:MAG: hypothetical protein RLZZ507_3945 [Cyanobacteriota bacterium]|jgi:poly(3-hydroxyalkanoate) synthetase